MDTTLGLWRRSLAEGVGTFFLVLAGCGAIVADARADGALGTVGIALVFGLVVMAMISAIGHLSGAHLNPAMTVAFALTRHLPLRDVAGYAAGQSGGAILAALLLLAAWPDRPADLGATVPSVGVATALAYEIALTAALMFVIISVATDVRAWGSGAALAIGGTVALNAMFAGPITGASMNPARSLGPALAAGTWQDFWLYVVGPVAGAALGALAYQFVRGEPARPARLLDQQRSHADGHGETRSESLEGATQPWPEAGAGEAGRV